MTKDNAAPKAWARLKLVSTSDHKAQDDIYLQYGLNSIGRREGFCDYAIRQPIISQIHCMVKLAGLDEAKNPTVFLQDRSRHGVYVNEELVGKGKTVKLRPNITVHFTKPGVRVPNIGVLAYKFELIPEGFSQENRRLRSIADKARNERRKQTSAKQSKPQEKAPASAPHETPSEDTTASAPRKAKVPHTSPPKPPQPNRPHSTSDTTSAISASKSKPTSTKKKTSPAKDANKPAPKSFVTDMMSRKRKTPEDDEMETQAPVEKRRSGVQPSTVPASETTEAKEATAASNVKADKTDGQVKRDLEVDLQLSLEKESALKEKVKSLENKNTSLEEQIKANKEWMKSQEKQMQLQRESTIELESQSRSLMNRITEMQNETMELREKLSHSEARVERLEAENAVIREEKTSARLKRYELEDELASLKEEHKKEWEELLEFEEDGSHYKKKFLKAKHDAKAMQKHVNELQGHFDAMVKRLQAMDDEVYSSSEDGGSVIDDVDDAMLESEATLENKTYLLMAPAEDKNEGEDTSKQSMSRGKDTSIVMGKEEKDMNAKSKSVVKDEGMSSGVERGDTTEWDSSSDLKSSADVDGVTESKDESAMEQEYSDEQIKSINEEVESDEPKTMTAVKEDSKDAKDAKDLNDESSNDALEITDDTTAQETPTGTTAEEKAVITKTTKTQAVATNAVAEVDMETENEKVTEEHAATDAPANAPADEKDRPTASHESTDDVDMADASSASEKATAPMTSDAAETTAQIDYDGTQVSPQKDLIEIDNSSDEEASQSDNTKVAVSIIKQEETPAEDTKESDASKSLPHDHNQCLSIDLTMEESEKERQDENTPPTTEKSSLKSSGERKASADVGESHCRSEQTALESDDSENSRMV